MVFFTVLFLLASVGLGERMQKGTRAQTCFTPSKKINFLNFLKKNFSMGGLRGERKQKGTCNQRGTKVLTYFTPSN